MKLKNVDEKEIQKIYEFAGIWLDELVENVENGDVIGADDCYLELRELTKIISKKLKESGQK